MQRSVLAKSGRRYDMRNGEKEINTADSLKDDVQKFARLDKTLVFHDVGVLWKGMNI